MKQKKWSRRKIYSNKIKIDEEEATTTMEHKKMMVEKKKNKDKAKEEEKKKEEEGKKGRGWGGWDLREGLANGKKNPHLKIWFGLS